MIRTVREAADYLLNYLSEPERAIPATVEDGKTLYPGRIDSVLQALNGAMQEMFSLGALHSVRRPFAEIVNAPKIETFDVAKGSRNLRFSNSSWDDWMIGCTCQIGGDDVDNQIVDYDSRSSTLTLKHPYAGDSSGEKQVTIYHDSVSLDSMAGEILSCNLENYGPLSPANSPKGMQPQTHDEEDFNFHGSYANHGFLSPGEKLTHFVGTPQRYFVDSFARENRAPEKRLRLFPLPDKGFVLSYRARVLPPQFAFNDLYLTIPQVVRALIYEPPFTVDLEWSDEDQHYKNDAAPSLIIQEDNGKWRYTVSFTGYSPSDTPGPNYEDGPIGTYQHEYLVEGGEYLFPVTVQNETEVVPISQPRVILPVQNDWVESVFLPIAAQRFQVSTFFRNDSATDEIKRQYEAALAILKTSAPQTKKGITIRPLHG